MTYTQAALSSWQIDLTEIFSSREDRRTTEESLSRLSSFVNAYCLFDRLFVPEKYRSSPFVGSLNTDDRIFVFDSRVSGDYEKLADGRECIDLDPALRFKNERNLKPNSKDWFKQHTGFDFKRGAPDFDFYVLILAEYQTLFSLSVPNDAFAVLFSSVSQVYLPSLLEAPDFSAYLGRGARKAGVRVQRDEVAGIFSFEHPVGAVEARIKTPPIFEAFVGAVEGEDFVSALQGLRRTYEPLRAAFRGIAEAFIQHPGNELVASDMTGPELDDWNRCVERHFDKPDEALLLKSDVAAIEICPDTGKDVFYDTLPERVRATSPLLRFLPSQSYLNFSKNVKSLRPLNIRETVRFKRKLFRSKPGYVNQRTALHPGLCSSVSFPVSAGAQLTRAGLNDAEIRSFGVKRPPYLYAICTRPAITVNPEVDSERDPIEMEFRFEYETHEETERVLFPKAGIRNVRVDPDGDRFTRVLFRGRNGEESSCHSSLLYQRIAASMVPDDQDLHLVDPERAGFSTDQTEILSRLDLEVVYIGKGTGEDFNSNAINRLVEHEKWKDDFLPFLEERKHLELWIVLLTPLPSHRLQMAGPCDPALAQDHDVKEMMRRIRKPVCIDPADRISFIEAALINHFKPRFNKTFVTGPFPSRAHESYERLFSAPLNIAAVELETRTSLGCRLYSGSVRPGFVHLKVCRFNASFDMGIPFPA